MSEPIAAEGLSKKYRIGELQRETTLGEALVRRLKRPFARKSNECIWALKDVSFAVGEGEVVGIIGRNGAGKSTLLKVLSKITHPTSGKLKVNGRIASLLEVGTGFHDELTGRENIYLNGSILGMKKREINARMDEIIEFAGVEKFIDTPIKTYSSGMRLRLGFAVAAHLHADVLLVDEVLAVGDAEFQKKCLKVMDNLSGSGRTVLFVSHNMEAVESLCERVVWIDGGRIRRDGDPREVIEEYMATFAGAGSTSFDFATVENRGGNGKMRFESLEMLDGSRLPVQFVRTGDHLVMRLNYRAKESIRSPHFGLEVYTEFGTRIISLNTWVTGEEITHLNAGSGSIEFEVESLNLVSGRYFLSVWVGSAGPVWYDQLDQCAMVDVFSADFYNSGREITSKHFGIVLVPFRWQIVQKPIRGNGCDLPAPEIADSGALAAARSQRA